MNDLIIKILKKIFYYFLLFAGIILSTSHLGDNYMGISDEEGYLLTIGKRLFVPEKLIMELQGHEIDGINSVYSDTYTENVRDEYHQKIIY